MAALSGGFRGGCLTGRTQWWLFGMSPWYEKPLADRFTTPYESPTSYLRPLQHAPVAWPSEAGRGGPCLTQRYEDAKMKSPYCVTQG
jgi:hypothetical protein